MESLQFVDRTYMQKHQSEDPHNLRAMYYPNLKLYGSRHQPGSKSGKKKAWEGIVAFLIRYGRKAALSLTILLLSYTPYVGKFVLPAASFYTFNKAVGEKPAVVIFACGLVLPRRYIVKFLQSYFSSRTLMRELVSKVLISLTPWSTHRHR